MKVKTTVKAEGAVAMRLKLARLLSFLAFLALATVAAHKRRPTVSSWVPSAMHRARS